MLMKIEVNSPIGTFTTHLPILKCVRYVLMIPWQIDGISDASKMQLPEHTENELNPAISIARQLNKFPHIILQTLNM